ncbi:MAG: 2-hydroxyglutaryl-CoA dehydratase [Deltaproteobacteria bacterium]|nr:2-hydroxyglutaryl-CoA dehydratase [Deltaproteobacteria bacterium]
MIVLGVDVGSLTAKAVLMKDGKIEASAVTRASANPRQSAQKVLDLLFEQTNIKPADVVFSVGTGYGRKQIPNVSLTESEIACHGRGAIWANPDVRTVVDIGGQDAKALRMDEAGNVVRYSYNDKCASGTGRFLEVMADALDVGLEDLGALSQKAEKTVRISNQCVVFAETEVITLVNDGAEPADIVRGLHQALAGRVAALAKSVGVEEKVAFTGGVAKNMGVAAALAEALAVELTPLDSLDPQLCGAIGAALLAQEKAKA